MRTRIQPAIDISYRGPFSSISSAPICYSKTIRNITEKQVSQTTEIDEHKIRLQSKEPKNSEKQNHL